MAPPKRALSDARILRRALADAFAKLHPRRMMKNPVMFLVEVGALFTTVLLFRATHLLFQTQITLWLWATVLFANFAEAVAEGRGKAQADALRRAKIATVAPKLVGFGRAAQVPASQLHKGDIVARIADLSSYRVDATISDLHASEIAAGMPVRVRVDETTTLNGAISSVEPRIENGIVKFHVRLDQPDASKLRNNLRVDVFAVTGHRDNALRVQRGALGGGDREDVYVVHGNNLLRTPVRWGLAGDQFLEPLEGLREGDEVVISNMNDYQGVKELRLK